MKSHFVLALDFEDEDDNYSGETRIVKNQFIPKLQAIGIVRIGMLIKANTTTIT